MEVQKFNTESFLNNFRQKSNEIIKQNKDFSHFENLIYEDFEKAIIVGAEFEQLRLNRKKGYVISETNLTAIKKLHERITAKHSSSKGILLCGGFGCGKSILMTSFFYFCNQYAISNNTTKYKIFESKCSDFSDKIDSIVIIDEIGRENTTVKDYGNETTPFIDYLLLRYKRGLLTFGISNFNMQSLTDKYGKYITDRFNEMFEVVVMKGNNYRNE